MRQQFFDPDPMLRRIERRTLLACAVLALAAWIVRGGPDVSIGILCGGLLIGVSYWAIRSSVTGLVALAAGPAQGDPNLPVTGGHEAAESPPAAVPGRAAILIRLAGRYALLGFLAYGMIARLRVHPAGLLIGMSSLFIAASLEAVRATGSAGSRRGA